MTDGEVQRRHFVVRGRVQRVGFRNFAVDSARALGVGGFVRNDADGSVAGEVEGPAAAVATFLQALRRGPRHAAVDRVDVEAVPPTGAASFDVR